MNMALPESEIHFEVPPHPGSGAEHHEQHQEIKHSASQAPAPKQESGAPQQNAPEQSQLQSAAPTKVAKSEAPAQPTIQSDEIIRGNVEKFLSSGGDISLIQQDIRPDAKAPEQN